MIGAHSTPANWNHIDWVDTTLLLPKHTCKFLLISKEDFNYISSTHLSLIVSCLLETVLEMSKELLLVYIFDYLPSVCFFNTPRSALRNPLANVCIMYGTNSKRREPAFDHP